MNKKWKKMRTLGCQKKKGVEMQIRGKKINDNESLVLVYRKTTTYT